MTEFNFLYYPLDWDIQNKIKDDPHNFDVLSPIDKVKEAHRRGYNWQHRIGFKRADAPEDQRQYEMKRQRHLVQKYLDEYNVNPHSLVEDPEHTGSSGFTRDVYALGGFKDPTVYIMYHPIREIEFEGTMSEIANKAVELGDIKIRRDWTGTQLVNGKSGHCKGWKIKGIKK